MKSSNDLRLFRRVLRQARGHEQFIVLLLLMNILATPLALLTPVPLKLAVDSVIGSEPIPAVLHPIIPASAEQDPMRLLIFVVVLLILISILARVRALLAALVRTNLAERLLSDFKALLFRHSQRLSMKYHDAAGSADAIYRIQYDSSAIQYVVIDGALPLVSAVITITAMLYVTASISWPLALVALCVVPLLAFLTAAFRGPLRKRWRHVKRLESGSLKIIQEVHGALRVVKAFGREDHEQQRYENQYRKGFRARLRVTLDQGLFDVLNGVAMAAGSAAVLYVGVRAVLGGTLSLGNLLLVIAYLGQLYAPIRTVGAKVASMQKNLASAERAFELLDQDPDVSERPDAIPIERARGHIELNDVSFRYVDDSPVLEHLDLEVRPGESIGIVGQTGAGKSTLMGLLTRFHDPTSGTVRLDGVDLREYRVKDLRDQFGIVLQDAVLFSTTVHENIAYARPDASRAEVVDAARAANAHQFIESLPDGYDTIVGERGMRLSGGERQRVSLARAFLKDAPILILDEPTSSVDLATEAIIKTAMQRLMMGRTTFMIAHRVGTLSDCDRILEIADHRLRDNRLSEITP